MKETTDPPPSFPPNAHVRRFAKQLGTIVLLLASTAIVGHTLAPTPAEATDHNEPQSVNAIADAVLSDASDIYGNFTWPVTDANGNKSMVFILTFPAPPLGFGYLDSGSKPEGAPRFFDEGAANSYDKDVLYAIHVDRDLDNIVQNQLVDLNEYAITTRFGYNKKARSWGVKVDGIPGLDGTIGGLVNSTITAPGAAPGTQIKVRAGLFDEPFVFDLQGFFDAQRTGVLDFDSSVDFFEGRNVHGIVLEIPVDNFDGFGIDGDIFHVWVSTHRSPDDPHIRPGNDCFVDVNGDVR